MHHPPSLTFDTSLTVLRRQIKNYNHAVNPTSTSPPYDATLENFLAFLIAAYILCSLFALIYVLLLFLVWTFKRLKTWLSTLLARSMVFGLHGELRYKNGKVVEVLVKDGTKVDEKWENAEWKRSWERVDRWIPVPTRGKWGVRNEFAGSLVRFRNRTV